MGIFPVYRQNGRLRGCFVYMLLCGDGGPIYIKIGISEDPLGRLSNLRTACPIRPDTFAYTEAPSRQYAGRIERGLHKEFQDYRTEGEWFRFDWDKKDNFNAGWKRVLEKFESRNWELKWTKLSVPEFSRQLRARKKFAQMLWRKRGLAYQDFVAACTADSAAV